MRRVLVAGVVVGLLLAALVAVFDEPAPPPARDAFVAAWRRSLTSTYMVTQVVERRLVSGRTFASEVSLVQRPPDRIRTSSAGTEARLGGRAIGCVPDAGCRTGARARPYAEDVDEEIGLLRAIVAGRTPLYGVTRDDDGCFVLVLRARILAPPYGEDAVFCFDGATGALRRSVVHRAEATDTTVTTELRAEVSDADLRLPADATASSP